MKRAKGSSSSSDDAGMNHQLGTGGALTCGARAAPLSSVDEMDERAASSSAAGRYSEQMETFNNEAPVFLDRTFTMIESISNDVMCWSEGGDSFIIKQARASERTRDAEGPVKVTCVYSRCACIRHVRPIRVFYYSYCNYKQTETICRNKFFSAA